jgi:hypothetical protein
MMATGGADGINPEFESALVARGPSRFENG